MEISGDQHNKEILENAEYWKAKPLLQRSYCAFYKLIAERIRRDLSGKTVEIGSGIGNLKMEIPDCVATDLFPNPWLDQTENAYALTFADATLANLILFDVFHHLEHPGAAMKEFARVLQVGGRLVIFEPGFGWLGRLVYGKFHHEPLGLGEKIEWEAPADFQPDEAKYYAAQANATRVFYHREFVEKLAGWRCVEVLRLPALAYLGSGGFRGPQLYPEFLYPVVRAVEKIAAFFPGISTTRLLVVLEKR